MLKHIVPDEQPQPVSASSAADRFPPVLEKPTLPVTPGSLARFVKFITGKGQS